MKRRFPFVLLFLLPATAAWADGVSPVLNLFHADTWRPATVVTAVIVLIESLLLRWWLRPITYGRALKLSFLVNVASSCAGSILLLLFGRDSYFMWDHFSLVVPLFAITLATEIPLLRLLSKTHPVSWKRVLSVGLGMNVASYLAVFALEIGLVFAFLARADSRDERNLARWRNPQLLERFSGTLYGTGGHHDDRLCLFDPRTQSWTDLTNGTAINPQKWDVESNCCAFIGLETANLKIVRLPDFTVLHEIPAERFKEPAPSGPASWQGFVDLALSPDVRRLAALFRVGEAVADRNNTSHYHLGNACRLIVFDVETGEEIARAPRRASGDLCWLPDSRSILFSSFDDDTLYDVPRSAVRGAISYGADYARDDRFAARLYAFHLDTGAVAPFAQGRSPSLAAGARQIFVHRDDDVLVLDTNGREIARLDLNVRRESLVVSPDGTRIFAEIPRHNPFYGYGVPVLLDPAAPDVRHALPAASSYRYDWTF